VFPEDEDNVDMPKWRMGVQSITGVNQAPTAANQVLIVTSTTPTPYPEFVDKPFVLETLAPAKEKIFPDEQFVDPIGPVDNGNDLMPDENQKEYAWVQSRALIIASSP
jgi:hypothetical protein